VKMAQQFWIDVTVQSRSVDVHGERSERRWCWLDFEEVYRRYKAFSCIQNGLDTAPEGDEWPESIDSRTYVKRAAFLALRPAVVKKGSVRECAFPICRDCGGAKGRLEMAFSDHRVTCEDGDKCACDNTCAAWTQFVKDAELDAAELRKSALEFQQHLRIVKLQRQEFEKQRANLGKPGFPHRIVLMDFSPSRRNTVATCQCPRAWSICKR
jgi:hypothetical protein